jgi:hypothetical protein
MYDDNDDDDILIIDEDDIRNGAVVVRRGSDRRGSGSDHRTGSGAGRASGRSRYPMVVRQPTVVARPVVQTTAPVCEAESSTKNLATWVPDALRGLAALMPLPAPPTAADDVGTNVANLITYFGALSQTAQRKEQLHTLAAIAARHL